MSIESSVNKAELEKFRKISDQWWKEDGEFKILHQINPIRLSYILEKMRDHFGVGNNKIDILDIGCGGGLITSKLSEFSNKIVGIDAVQENIDIAAEYARQHNLDIVYKRSTIEEYVSYVVNSGGFGTRSDGAKPMSNRRATSDNVTKCSSIDYKQYDMVLCLEVMEHVDNPSNFVKNLTSLVKPNGMVIISTINRTPKAYLLAIIMAEYVLNWVPRKTHDYSKFLKPSEINSMFNENSMELNELKGLTYNLASNSWQLSNDIDVNYFACFTKKDN